MACPGSQPLQISQKPFQAFACWNVATAFTVRPIMEQKICFRAVHKGKGKDEECYTGEPTLFCKAMRHEGHRRIAVVASVDVGYDDEESTIVKQTHR
jgi:alpha-1,3-mannosyltransferase